MPTPRSLRGTGRTTRLWEHAVWLAGELPEGQTVFITGPHVRWILDLARDAKASGLVGVEIITLTEIMDGRLRGRRGRLLIDDIEDIEDHRVWETVRREQRIMENGS